MYSSSRRSLLYNGSVLLRLIEASEEGGDRCGEDSTNVVGVTEANDLTTATACVNARKKHMYGESDKRARALWDILERANVMVFTVLPSKGVWARRPSPSVFEALFLAIFRVVALPLRASSSQRIGVNHVLSEIWLGGAAPRCGFMLRDENTQAVTRRP